jgi:hypothetical protein
VQARWIGADFERQPQRQHRGRQPAGRHPGETTHKSCLGERTAPRISAIQLSASARGRSQHPAVPHSERDRRQRSGACSRRRPVIGRVVVNTSENFVSGVRFAPAACRYGSGRTARRQARAAGDPASISARLSGTPCAGTSAVQPLAGKLQQVGAGDQERQPLSGYSRPSASHTDTSSGRSKDQ